MSKAFPFLALFLLIIVALLTFNLSQQNQNPQTSAKTDAEKIVIDLSAPTGPVTHKAAAILHSLTPTGPRINLVSPLKLQTIRDPVYNLPDYYSYFQSLGLTIEAELPDKYATYKKSNHWPCDNGDCSAWKTYTKDQAKYVRDHNLSVRWDIWNEPDNQDFWRRSFDQYLQMWKAAHKSLRSVDPNAVIVGPSMPLFSRDWLDKFLTFAKKENVLPNILSWHENTDNDLHQIENHVKIAQDLIAEKGVGPMELEVNEAISANYAFKPGAVVTYLAQAERTALISFSRTCWLEGSEQSSSDCFNNSLDGLLNANSQPRSVWHVYRYYGTLNGQMLSASKTASFDAVSAINTPENSVRTVIGNFTASPHSLTLVFKGISATQLHSPAGVAVITRRIPNSSGNPLAKAILESKKYYSVTGDKITVNLQLAAFEAVMIRLRPDTTETADEE